MKNTERLPGYILTALRDFYDDDTINILTNNEIFDMWLTWDGYVHAFHHLTTAINDIYNIDITK